MNKFQNEAAKELVCINYDVEPVGLDILPELVRKEDDQRAPAKILHPYNWSMVASFVVDLGHQVPTRSMVPTYLLMGLRPLACNICHCGWNQYLAYPCIVEARIFYGACMVLHCYPSGSYSLYSPHSWWALLHPSQQGVAPSRYLLWVFSG